MQQTNCIKTSFAALVLVATALTASAQGNGCNSSYSRFGLGIMDYPAQGHNINMGGVAQGIRDGRKVNMLNPASYSVIDSLSFIFDANLNFGYGHMSDGHQAVNVRNTSLGNVNMGFRLMKGLGMSLGFTPYSTIGYNFSQSARVGSSFNSTQSITTVTTYQGDGGLHQMYIGAGWNPFAGLSVGANVNYLWGTYDHATSQTFYEGSTANATTNSLHSLWSSDIRTYKIDLGLQYALNIGTEDKLTLGASATLGHKIKSAVEMQRYTPKDTTKYSLDNGLAIPYTFSGGVSYAHGTKWLVAADYTMERWDGCSVPVIRNDGEKDILVAADDQYLSRHRFNAGGEYCINPLSNRYFERIRFRAGASYATPNVKVNGHNGPTECSVTAGVGLPMTYSSKSLINVGASWLRRSAPNLIKENYLMLNVGVTFNERWFMKWKIN
ncbi:MAG: hypothetical protein HUK02_02895 [Bacteroidaceae bacterium]|nr:hypothetical protein [Bacteroidaceae bacterium]